MSTAGWLYIVLRVLISWCAILLFSVRIWGRRNVPAKGGVILACNHQSFFDPPLVGLGVSRICCFMARDTLFKNRPFAALIRYVNAFPVKRGTGDVGAFKQLLRLLRADRTVVLFPEATRSLTGRIRPVQPGVIAVARKAGATIVPVAVEGAFDTWPRSSRWPRRGRIWVEYGPALAPAAFDGRTSDEAAAVLTDIMRDLHNRLRRRAGRPPFEYAVEPVEDSGPGQDPAAD